MPVKERRRIALHNHVAAAWGEEAADTLFDRITPAGRNLATRAGVEARFTGVDAQFAALAFGLR
jgi:hypothetical protein